MKHLNVSGQIKLVNLFDLQKTVNNTDKLLFILYIKV